MLILRSVCTQVQFGGQQLEHSAENGSTTERRAANISKAIYNCGQPHGTLKVRGGRCKTQRQHVVVDTLPGLEQTSPTTVVAGTE